VLIIDSNTYAIIQLLNRLIFDNYAIEDRIELEVLERPKNFRNFSSREKGSVTN